MTDSFDVAICGAGIAGISAAYHLAGKRGLRNIALVDERPPMSLTSDKSTEAYRNWWPGPDGSMVAFMNRSIDLLDDWAGATNNVFHLNRRGYLYCTADPKRARTFVEAAVRAAAQGAGTARLNHYPGPGEDFALDGADVLIDPDEIRRHFPYLTPNIAAVVHARRCGWFSSTDLGSFLLESAVRAGVTLINDKVVGVDHTGGRVRGVKLGSGRTLTTGRFVNAAGPFVGEVGRLLDLDLPIYSERHTKIAFRDTLNVIPRNAPFTIWADPQTLAWDEEERAFLADDPETKWMTEPLPGGAHFRTEGGEGSNMLLMLWAYDAHEVPLVMPPQFDDSFTDVVLRGLTTMVPGLKPYLANTPKPMIDGGYYTKTKENRFMVGPLPVEGAYLMGAFSGYGLMAAPAAGELLAAHVADEPLPAYASAFLPSRYDDPEYVKLLESWGETGQL